MLGASAIERAGLKAWPGIDVEWDGTWVRRASNGYTKRANSIQCMDPADDGDAEARVVAAREWFAARGLPAIFRTNLLTGPRLAAELDRQGWSPVDHSSLMAMELDTVDPDPNGIALSVDDPSFLRAQQQLRGYDEGKLAKLRAILAVLDVPAAGTVVYAPDGRPVSSALMAVADGIVITGNVITDVTERQKGYAKAMMRTGLAWARQAGASIAALNVARDNVPGIALYESLGYARQYDYVYRIPGEAK
ncbi:GNAT family N-acetyltransferase [Pelagibacterium limicola]|uniref:GNAT family N-acetyltransferase n=1 Tax=Pelagibacterium limicola TaxID=2791022 RepID=UPI0018AF59BA|nr:GNAT family N-acetyltransferase [Pelagibacterium limicola]